MVHFILMILYLYSLFPCTFFPHVWLIKLSWQNFVSSDQGLLSPQPWIHCPAIAVPNQNFAVGEDP